MGEMSFPPDLQNWIDSRVAEGRYADAQDYLRDLVRRDQEGMVAERGESPEYIAWVREKVAEGLTSGVCEKDAFEVLDEIRTTRETRRG